MRYIDGKFDYDPVDNVWYCVNCGDLIDPVAVLEMKDAGHPCSWQHVTRPLGQGLLFSDRVEFDYLKRLHHPLFSKAVYYTYSNLQL